MIGKNKHFIFSNDTPPPEDCVLIAGVYIKVKKKKKKKKFCDIKSPLVKKAREDISTLKRRIKQQRYIGDIHPIGYSAKDLMKRLEKQFTNGMSWDNIGEWHIDHIIPIYKFTLSHEDFSPQGFSKIVNSLDNLQPLWARDNLKKSRKY